VAVLKNVIHIEMEVVALAPTRSRSQTVSVVWTQSEDDLLVRIMETQPSIPSWCSLVAHFQGKTAQQIAGRWENVLNPNLVKGSWTREEDLVILSWVRENGPGNWVKIATRLPGRIGKQCRERWTNHLCPQVVKGQWTLQEDTFLIELHRRFGNQWTKIAGFMPGRTDNCVKNRWHSTIKRRIERIANGEPLVRKRGRKPKTQSGSDSECSPTAERIELPSIASMEIFVAPAKRDSGRYQNALDVRSLINPAQL
jgi:hypothetical protein